MPKQMPLFMIISLWINSVWKEILLGLVIGEHVKLHDNQVERGCLLVTSKVIHLRVGNIIKVTLLKPIRGSLGELLTIPKLEPTQFHLMLYLIQQ